MQTPPRPDVSCSVIICTHNPRADYLRRVLEALRRQTLPKENWELLVIDNASSQPVEGVFELTWHPNARHIREDELGLTPARLRAIRESTGAVLVYVDDDSIIAPNYLETALALFESHGWLGVMGAGKMEPEYETAPSQRFRRILPLLAIRNAPRAIWSNNPDDAAGIPYGAGLCVRRVVGLRYRELLARMNANECLDRRGGVLTCGGDDLFSYTAAFDGGGFGVFPELQVTHLIRASRLSAAYLLKLVESHAFSHTIIRHLLSREPMYSGGRLQKCRRILSLARDGVFDVRAELAAQRGNRRGCQYISERGLTAICI